MVAGALDRRAGVYRMRQLENNRHSTGGTRGACPVGIAEWMVVRPNSVVLARGDSSCVASGSVSRPPGAAAGDQGK